MLVNLLKNKKIYIAIIAALIVAIGALSAVLIYNNINSQPAAPTQGVVGEIRTDWDTGIDENSKGSDNTKKTGVQIPGYSTAEMNAGDTSLHISIGNPKSNTCGLYATLRLSDGTVLYKSDLLEPGSGLTDVPLSKSLEKGEYQAMVLYDCVTLDDSHQKLNSAESEFTLKVK